MKCTQCFRPARPGRKTCEVCAAAVRRWNDANKDKRKAQRKAKRASIETLEDLVPSYQGWLPHILAVYKKEGPIGVRRYFYALEQAPHLLHLRYPDLSRGITQLREVGAVPWRAVLDGSGRKLAEPTLYDSPIDYLEGQLPWWQLPARTGQRIVEVWLEKIGLLVPEMEKLSEEFQVVVQANAGHSSATFINRGVERLLEQVREAEEAETATPSEVLILYVGDHDPSGLFMDEDILDRVQRYSKGELDVEFRRVALTMEQIKRHKLPHNPDQMKEKDPHRDWYIEKTKTKKAWHVEALPTDLMISYVRKALEEVTDEKVTRTIAKRTARMKKLVLEGLANIRDEVDALE